MPLEILIPLGLGIILLIVFIRIYPLLHIGFTKVIFGKYSSRYIATHKQHTSQSPYPYCIKDDFINHIAGFYKNGESTKKYNSEKEISFLDTDFNSDFKSVLRARQKPFCINSNRLPLFDLKVLGYKDQMFTSEMKKYFFFADDKFFLGQLRFKNPDKENIKKIIGIICKKYLEVGQLDTDNFIIYGKNQSVLHCNYNGFHLSLSYLSRSMDDINLLMDTYWHNTTNVSIGKTTSLESELMDKL